MARIEIEAQPRRVLGKKVRALRRQGIIPANLYSPGTPSTPLQLDAHTLERALFRIEGPTEVYLKVADQPPTRVVIKDVQMDPRRGGMVHVDFFLPAQSA